MVRLDVLLTQRGLAESREQAKRMIMAGEVRVQGQVVLKSSHSVAEAALLEVAARPPFVSRGGEKLEAALSAFEIEVAGGVCADVGASTGGFTDCLLQRGAARVYAIDVGQGQLDWKLRNDPRVVTLENTNARYLDALPEPLSLVTVDASFISLRLLLPVIQGWGPEDVVALIKPQFEAGRKEVRRGGVVRDPAVHRRVLEEVAHFAATLGLGLHGLIRSPLTGPAGNLEFLAWWRSGAARLDIPATVSKLTEP